MRDQRGKNYLINRMCHCRASSNVLIQFNTYTIYKVYTIDTTYIPKNMFVMFVIVMDKSLHINVKKVFFVLNYMCNSLEYEPVKDSESFANPRSPSK